MSELQAGVAQKAGGQFRVAANAPEAAVERSAKDVDCRSTHVGQFARLHIAPDLFDLRISDQG